MELLGEIDEQTVDFEATYDGQNQEPLVLPARFPNLLVNGGGGIAVGMATNIPPHNLGEIIDAAVHMVDNPDAKVSDLMKIVKGPDFPTGALILGKDGIKDAYTKGRGSIKMRAVAEIDEGTRGEVRIVITEVPFQTSVETIGAKIAELVNERKLEGIRDVRNESAGDTPRLVVELRRDANANVVLNQLYKHTPMQTSFAANMLALVDGVPMVLTLDRAVLVYVAHQMEVVTRRTEFRLGEAKKREHIVEGLVKALSMIDKVVALIRGAADVDAARAGLMAKPFEFSEIQANYILDMQLRRLTQLEGKKLRDELAELQALIKELESILKSKAKLRKVVKDELLELKGRYADDRRTRLTVDTGEIDVLDLIEDEEVVLVLTNKGYVKTVAADAFRKQSRGGRGVRGSRARDDDYVDKLLTTTAHSYLLFFSNRGKVYRLRAHEIPMKDRTARDGAREPDHVGARRAHPSDHRHPDLRRGRVPVLHDQERHGQEDPHDRVRHVGPQRPDRHQPRPQRRARPRDPEHGAQRRRHGHAQRPDDPVLGERRPSHGPSHGRRARDEAQAGRFRGGRRRLSAGAP